MLPSINIKDYFQHSVLTPCPDSLNYENLAQLQKEIRANGKSVPSNLGGGTQGHLGLVTSATTYARINPNAAFNRPVHPGTLVQVPNATQYIIAEAVRQHDADLREFNLCNLVERTIIQQINKAVDDECLADLIDEETGLLTGTVPEILKNLFDTYGDITAQSLAAKKSKVEAMTYSHDKPLATIFHSINDFATMAEASGAPTTQAQLIDIGLINITNATIFASDIRKWHDKPANDKTWTNFKKFFTTAQRAIIRSQPQQTLAALGFHNQANAASIADEVIARIATQQAAEHARAEEIAEESAAAQQMQEQLQQMANSTQQQTTMLDQINALTATIRNLESQMHSSDSGWGRDGGRGKGNRGRGGRGSGGRERRQRLTGKYCWTHGSCGHNSSNCRNQAEGHKNEATMLAKHGGSTRGCDTTS